MNSGECKICGSSKLKVFSHTAKCVSCGVLLYYPYPPSDSELVNSGAGKTWPKQKCSEWYDQSSFYNHDNFTAMLRFAVDDSFKGKNLDILDFGGGGGQFALVCRSHFPRANVYITDICDEALLDEWSAINIQIPYRKFLKDENKFDFIFLNDVFEHVSDPLETLKILSGKLKEDGKIFIDTPRQFWIYSLTKLISKKLYQKVLRGTVSAAHLQIWSKNSFELVLKAGGLKIYKYEEWSEYTMPADFYMNLMGINNPIIRALGHFFHANSKRLASNKIVCLTGKI